VRITRQQKSATRRRILDVAARLFRTVGYEATTTRDIALAAEIAAGTLFNYFPTKEAIVAALAEAALHGARAEQDKIAAAGLEEALFALVAAELRRLKPHRKYLTALFETSLSPLTVAAGEPAQRLRTQSLETAAALIRRHRFRDPGPLGLQLYWTLHTGVLAFWAADRSPKQEDTLALLDESMAMFVGWLRSTAQPE
jgi:AcrR family transcriptional regulator